MPVWLEILINVTGYAGFLAVATFHRSPGNKLPDRWAQRSRARGPLTPTPAQWINAPHTTPVTRLIARVRKRLPLFSWNEQGAHFPALLPG